MPKLSRYFIFVLLITDAYIKVIDFSKHPVITNQKEIYFRFDRPFCVNFLSM